MSNSRQKVPKVGKVGTNLEETSDEILHLWKKITYQNKKYSQTFKVGGQKYLKFRVLSPSFLILIKLI